MKIVVNTRSLIYFTLLGLVLVVLGVVLGYKVFPSLVEKKVWENSVLRNGTRQWEFFKKVPFPFQMKVYLFNVENPEAILHGAKPVLKETGPYIYKVEHWRDDIVWDSEDEVSYYDMGHYEFDHEASGIYSDEDNVTVLNAPFNAIVLTIIKLDKDLPATIYPLLPDILGENHSPFLTATVKDLMFDGITLCENGGGTDFYAKFACRDMQGKVKSKRVRSMRFGANNSIIYANMQYKNHTRLGRLTVNSGINENEALTDLVKYNNGSEIRTWGKLPTASCDNANKTWYKVRGTTQFRPYVTPSMTFEVFSEDICRVLPMEYRSTETVQNIKGHKYVVPSTSLNPPEFQDNTCPCVDGKRGCPQNSLFDLSKCVVFTIIIIFLSLNSTPVLCKIYERCELALELKQKHELPLDQISTWLCIVKHESVYNTSAVNRASGDHGLFQISDIYWCSVPGAGLKACDSPCSAFEDDDITDDVACVRRIFNEHTGLSGNGFNAWVVYPRYCQGDVSHYLQGCFENEVDNTYYPDPSTPQLNQTTDEEPVYEFPPLPKPPKFFEQRNETNEITPFSSNPAITEVFRQTYLTSISPAAAGIPKTSLDKVSTGSPPYSVEVDNIKFIPNTVGIASTTLQPSTGLYYNGPSTFPYKSESTKLPSRSTLKPLVPTSTYLSNALSSQPEPTRPTSKNFASRIGPQTPATFQPRTVSSSVSPVFPSKPESFGVAFKPTTKPRPLPTDPYPSTKLASTGFTSRTDLKPSTTLAPSTTIYEGGPTVPFEPESSRVPFRSTSRPSVSVSTYASRPLPPQLKSGTKFASIDFASRVGLISPTTSQPGSVNFNARPAFPSQPLRPNLKPPESISTYFPKYSTPKTGLGPSYLSKKPELRPTLKPFQPFVSSRTNTRFAESYKSTKSPSIAFKSSVTTSGGEKPQAPPTTKPYYLSTARASPFKRVLSQVTTTRKPLTKSPRHFSTLKPFSKLVESARNMNIKREQKFHGFGNSEYTFVWKTNGFKLMLNPK